MSVQDGGAPAPETPTGGAPGGAPPPPAPAPAPAPAPRAAAPHRHKPKHGNRGNHQQPFDENPAVMKRIRQEADRLLRKQLGDLGVQDLEEVKKLIAQARSAGKPPAELQALQEKVDDLSRRLEKAKRQKKRLRAAKTAEMTALEMRHEAVTAGIPEQYADVALDIYQRLWGAFDADPTKVDPIIKAGFEKDPIDGKAIFAWIRARHIPGAVAPETVELTPTTAPPESRAPGGGPPDAKPPNTPPEVFDANKLNAEQWRAHKRSMGLSV